MDLCAGAPLSGAEHSSPALPDRTAPISRSSCSARATTSSASCATRAAHATSQRSRPHRARLRRPARPARRSPQRCASIADGGLQPRLAVVRPAIVGASGRDGRVRGGRRDLAARGDPRRRRDDPRLPGIVERDLRRACRGAADGVDAALAVTPYGVAKAYGHFIVGSYRRRYGLHASGGILYNHESPRRPVDFLPSKVAHGAAAISLGLRDELLLGDLDAQRDWGYAGDYVDAMWRIVQRTSPATT